MTDATPAVPKLATVIEVDGEPRSSCCRARLTPSHEVGPDVAVFHVEEMFPAEGEHPRSLRVSFVKTYDGMDSGPWVVNCEQCGGLIDIGDIEIEEG